MSDTGRSAGSIWRTSRGTAGGRLYAGVPAWADDQVGWRSENSAGCRQVIRGTDKSSSTAQDQRYLAYLPERADLERLSDWLRGCRHL